MVASPERAWPCSCWIARVVVCTASHAVAAIEPSAISRETAVSRTTRLRLRGKLRVIVRRQVVAHAEDGAQVDGSLRVGLELLAQVEHVDVDDPGADEPVVAAGELQQLPAGEHPARLPDQRLEQLELTWRRLHRAAVDRHL